MLDLFGFLTLLGDIGIAVFVIILIGAFLKIPAAVSLINAYKRYVPKYNLQAGFLIALLATGGSLYLSEVRGFEPCLLCWYQRIFMYPQVIILLVAILENDAKVSKYVFPLSLLGMIIAGYHYYEQTFKVAILPCSIGTVSCQFNYTLHYGYITIPMMSLTAFILILFLINPWLLRGKEVS